MIKRENALRILKENRLIAVIRSESAQKAVKIAEACAEGGIRSIEITFTIPRPHRIIETLAEKFEGSGIIIGAGTVLDAESARIAMLSGADFIVSPTADAGMLTMCNRYGILSAAGATTSNEIQHAVECGAGTIKLFPANYISPNIISIMRGPFPNTDYMVTGNMNEQTISGWFEGGVSVVGVGSVITGPAAEDDYSAVRASAEKLTRFVSKIT